MKPFFTRVISSIFILIAIFSCRFGDLDPRIIGVWEADETQLTVREELSFLKFKFTQGTASVHLEIDENYIVNGRVGDAVFEGGAVQVNKDLLPPKYSGIVMTVSCRLKGKIFDEDPTASKEVEFWIYYPIEDNSFLSELRFTEGGSQFPMTLFSFHRVE